MPYDYSELTPEFVLNYFLYGQSSTPAALVDNNLIRTGGIASVLVIDAVTFMETGPGRFAQASMSTLVQQFFTSSSSALNGDGQRHEYSIEQLKQLIPGSDVISLQQYNYDDGSGDLGIRNLIWGSSGFKLGADVKFVVDEAGHRTIENLSVRPLDDNFDFTSGNPVTAAFEALLQSWMDPSGIGRKLEFVFQNTGLVPRIASYSETDFNQSLAHQSDYYQNIALNGPEVYSATSDIADDLWDQNITKFLDIDQRAIAYAQPEGGVLDQRGVAGDPYLTDYVPNGIAYVGSQTNDIFKDTVGSDVMLGGVGQDTADFSGAGGLSVTFGSATYSGTAAPILVASLQIDGRTGADLLSAVEIVKLSGGADTVKIDAGAKLSEIQTVDAAGQGPGTKDVLDFSQFGTAIVLTDTKLNLSGTNFVNFEKLVLTNEADTIFVTSPAKLSGFQEIDGAGGADTINFSQSSAAVTFDINKIVGADPTFSNFENLIGSNYGDTFTFSSSTDLFGVQRIDAGQQGASHDTLDFTRFDSGTGITIADHEIAATHTRIDGFEVIKGTAARDVIDYANGTSKLEIYGNGGNDDIKTAAGDDRLDGGEGKDVLSGGDGSDQYFVTNADTVIDSDGEGRVTVDSGVVLSGGERKGSSGAFTNPSNGDKYLWQGEGDSSGDLIVISSNTRVLIKDFHNGDLGITLKEIPKPDPFPRKPFKDPLTSPLALDLDGNGVSLASTDAGVHFDFGGDHFRELTGWVGPGDGFLVYDANQDGTINDTTELFGNASTNGFNVLAFYDGRTGGNYYSDPSGGTIDAASANGAIDANDAIFGQLQVWRDLNQDGVAQANELTSLATEGIARINLSHASPDDETALGAELTGNKISDVGTFERQDGSSASIVDAWFSVDPSDTIYDGPPVAGLEHWPDLHGYGNLDQLHNAISTDPELAANVRIFIDKIQGQPISSLMPQFEKLVYEWAGIPEDYSVYRGEFINPRVMAFLEDAYGAEYIQTHGWNEGTNAPGMYSATVLTNIFQNAVASYFVKFLAQVPEFTATVGDAEGNTYVSKYAPLAAALHYDPIDDSVQFDATALATALASTDLADAASVQNALDIFGLLTVFEAYQIQSNEQFYGALRDALVSTGATKLLPLIDSFRIHDSTLTFTMSAEDDVYDYPVRSFIFENYGEYTIVGAGATIVDRQVSDPHYVSDLFYVQSGLGTVTFEPQRGTIHDKVVLSAEFNGAPYTIAEDVQNGDVRIVFSTLGTTLLLKSYLDSGAERWNSDWLTGAEKLIGQTIYFADGTLLRPTDIAEALIQGSDNNDVLKGLWLDQTIDGEAGDDVINSNGYANTIIGGTGNDQLSGNNQFGSYVFNVGDGNDTISQSQGSTLQLNGIVPADVHLARGGSGNADLLITFPGHPDDSINILNEFGTPSIAKIVFGDGTVWTLDDIQTRLVLQNASDGDDVIVGFDGSDVLAGGRGNDILQGGPSSFGAGDTYLYATGDGNDTIIPSSVGAIDTLRLIGIRSDQVTVTRNGSDIVLTFLVPEGGSVSLQDQLGSYGFHGLEKVVFSDGVIWSQRDFIVQSETPIVLPTVTGTEADETLTGTDGNDGLAGLGGDDILRGGAGSDTYFFGVGSGHDRIEDNGHDDYHNVDTVKLSLLPTDVELTRGATDVVIKIIATGETLTLPNFFWGDYTTAQQSGPSIERVVFSDGTVWDVPQITANAWIRGTVANDTIVGTRDDDTIYGATGNDYLEGGRGSDTYIIASGGGQDTILEYTDAIDGANDIVKFVDSTIDDVVFRIIRDEATAQTSLSVGRSDGSAAALFDLQFGGGVERLQFSDGTVLSFQEALARVEFVGTDGTDTISAQGTDDKIIGGKGDDELRGNEGNDTYFWSRGDGNDVIIEYQTDDSRDTLHLSGIDPSLVRLERLPQPNGFGDPFYDLAVHILPFQTTDIFETITIMHEFDLENQWPGRGLEYIEFDNGTIWSRAQFAALAPLVGTPSAETLSGSQYADVLEGRFGDDVLKGGAGNDTYVWTLGDGNDRIQDGYDGDNFDTLMLHNVDPTDVQLSLNTEFESQDVLIQIGASGEEIRLSNQLSGDSRGIDRIIFDNGDVWNSAYIAAQVPHPVFGTEEDDTLVGDSRDNEISGLGGNDTISGLNGNDTISGDWGDDLIDGGAGDDQLDGGSGWDTLTYASASVGVTVDLGQYAPQDTLGAGVDQLSGFEVLVGSNYADVLRGSSGDNELYGLAGADKFVFTGSFGSDYVGDFSVQEDVLQFSSTIFADRAAVLAAASEIDSHIQIDAGQSGSVSLGGLTLADLENAQIQILTPPNDVLVKPASTDNTGFATAVSVDDGIFDVAANPDIFESTTIPHATVAATASGLGKEYYSFSLVAGDHVTFDIDQGSFDTVIQLFDESGTPLATNDDSDGDPGSYSFNSLLDYTVTTTGTYFLSVGSYSNSDTSGAPLNAGATYNLNISIEREDAGPSGLNNASLSASTAAENLSDQAITDDAGVNEFDSDPGAEILTGGAGNDSFKFNFGEANGDVVKGFAGAGALVGDHLDFYGYGTLASGAKMEQIAATDFYQIIPDAAHGGVEAAETLQILNVFDLNTAPDTNDFILH